MKRRSDDMPKPRDPSSFARSRGALRTRTIPNKKKARLRGAKHKKDLPELPDKKVD